ncbi:DJ-1/YajL/PfpI superfamily includes chaperone protein YajL (former ThiJ) parkinsonism-associated protein DJ-1 peptidases PfpI Hsp31 [Salmonella enterica subsp. enterica]|nr:DJ-1/YajL/PfpI superfamily includes chaperone protein YajL (former ThiJ) parkinsonism-associated protein DJ-1 peptidases PfpI Hsp31 [Salmonella enterica subsp. enterica]
MKKVAVLLAPGFEEAEAIVTLDILRRFAYRRRNAGVC